VDTYAMSMSFMLRLLVVVWAVSAAGAASAGVLAYAAGDVAECKSSADRSDAAKTAKMIPPDGVVFVVGDTTYPFADKATLQSCYTPTWGQFLSRTYAVPGNHDYVEGSAKDFLEYFGARTPDRTYFRAQVGDWWVIGLDSNLHGAPLAEQQAWLEDQLHAIEGDGRCVLAMWHHPVFSTGLHRKDGQHMRPAWVALANAGADLVLNGHEHFYESFEPKDALGRTQPTGLREIIAGTGGARLLDLSLVRGAKVYVRVHGLLELKLERDHYEFAFRQVNGRIRDQGFGQCRRVPLSSEDEATHR
jgi:Calcineurin-like phosphoesterase